jgi:hypothetical protein
VAGAIVVVTAGALLPELNNTKILSVIRLNYPKKH